MFLADPLRDFNTVWVTGGHRGRRKRCRLRGHPVRGATGPIRLDRQQWQV